MNSNSKALFILSFCVLFIFSAKKSFAQHFTPGPILMGTYWDPNPKGVYKVTFKDSSVKEVFSIMYVDPKSHKNYLVFVDRNFPKSDTIHRNQKIYPDQTLYIATNRDIQSDKEIYGIPNDSCWMFPVIGGRLTVYARSMNYLKPVSGFVDSNELYEATIIGIQINDGPILPFTEDNLKNMVGQNAKALELISEKKYFRAIKRYNSDAEKEAKN
jgi:hypothetical protein